MARQARRRPATKKGRPRWYKVVPRSRLHQALDAFQAGIPAWVETFRVYGEQLGIGPILAYRCDLDRPLISYRDVARLRPLQNHFREADGAWTPKRSTSPGRELDRRYVQTIADQAPPTPPVNLLGDRGFRHPAFVAKRAGCYYIVRHRRRGPRPLEVA